jgi:hypothetical protein
VEHDTGGVLEREQHVHRHESAGGEFRSMGIDARGDCTARRRILSRGIVRPTARVVPKRNSSIDRGLNVARIYKLD